MHAVRERAARAASAVGRRRPAAVAAVREPIQQRRAVPGPATMCGGVESAVGTEHLVELGAALPDRRVCGAHRRRGLGGTLLAARPGRARRPRRDRDREREERRRCGGARRDRGRLMRAAGRPCPPSPSRPRPRSAVARRRSARADRQGHQAPRRGCRCRPSRRSAARAARASGCRTSSADGPRDARAPRWCPAPPRGAAPARRS